MLVLIGFSSAFQVDAQQMLLRLSDRAWQEITDEELEELVEDYDVNSRNAMDETPLMMAATSADRPSVLGILLDAGASVNATNKNGMTPLMYAAANNSHADVVQYLVSAGANVSTRTPRGWTALMWAADHNDNPDVIQVLLNAGARLDDSDETGLSL
jgi:ankyrin repeat protein